MEKLINVPNVKDLPHPSELKIHTDGMILYNTAHKFRCFVVKTEAMHHTQHSKSILPNDDLILNYRNSAIKPKILKQNKDNVFVIVTNARTVVRRVINITEDSITADAYNIDYPMLTIPINEICGFYRVKMVQRKR